MGELNFMSFEEFNNKIHNLDSGVYLITDHNDKVVYVGKAFKIKTRVHAHFNGYSNTKDYAHLFNKVAYILEDSPLKRSLLEITYMIKYKTVLNKEVQEEFPNLYTDYIKNTNEKYKKVKMIPGIDEAYKQAQLEDAVRDIEKGEHRVATPQIVALQKERARERDRFKKRNVQIRWWEINVL